MKIVPLSKEIVEECNKLSIKFVSLNFSGGSDEGYLYVDVTPFTSQYRGPVATLLQKIEAWAWQHYQYGGGGDGSDYGDDIEYNIENNSATHESWQTERTYERHGTTNFN